MLKSGKPLSSHLPAPFQPQQIPVNLWHSRGSIEELSDEPVAEVRIVDDRDEPHPAAIHRSIHRHRTPPSPPAGGGRPPSPPAVRQSHAAARSARSGRKSALRGRCCGPPGMPIASAECRPSEAAGTKTGGQALLNRRLLLALSGAAALALAVGVSGGASAQEKIKIGFLPGVVDPFYQVMQIGVEKAAADLGLEVVTQIPPTWGVAEQTPILDALIARGDLDYIITAPVDKDQMVGPLQAAVDAGIKIITVDTFLGDGDYAGGPVTFPISYIGSDNVEGGRISARGLAKAIGGKGTVYINSTNPNVSSVEGREQGFAEVMANEFPDIKVIGPDYNLDDAEQGDPADRRRARARARSRRRLRHQRLQRPGCRPGGDQRRARRPRPGRRLRRHQGRDRVDEQGRRHPGPGAEALRHGLHGGRSSPPPTPPASPACPSGSRPASRSSTRTTSPTPRSRASSTRCPAADRRRTSGSAPRALPPRIPTQEGDRVTALDHEPARGPDRRRSAPSSPFSRLWAWAFLGAHGRVLRHRGAARQRRRRQLPDHPQLAEHPRRHHAHPAARARARPSSSSAPASTSRSAG